MINLKVDVVMNQSAVLLKSSAVGRTLMQTGIIDTVFTLFANPLILILTLWIVGVIIAVAVFRRPRGAKKAKDEAPSKETKKTKIKAKGPFMKQIGKMISDAEKGKDLTAPPVRSRNEIITEMFESKMDAIGLKASTSSGYVPVSHTPFTRFLKDHGVPEATIGAFIEAILEADNENDVRSIVGAVADSLGVQLVGNDLDKVTQLAVDEWRNIKNPPET